MTLAHGLPLLCRLGFCRGHLAHDLSGLCREIHGGADHDHSLDALGLRCSHVEKDVASHAHADRAAPLDAQMIEQRKCVRRAVSMSNYLVRVCRTPVPASIWFYQFV